MANYDILKESIAAVIKENSNQEITGNLLQQTLFAMVNSLGGGYEFAGVADQAVIPGTPDTKLFYIAAGPGLYTNFGDITVNNGELAIFFIPEGYGSWYKQSVPISVITDAVPTEGSLNPVQSGGVANAIATQIYRQNVQRRLDWVINGREGYGPPAIHGYINSANKWFYNEGYSYVILPLKSGDTVYLKKGAGVIVYGLLSTFEPPVWNTAAPFLEGQGRQSVSNDATISISTDCYLYLLENSDNTINFPGILSINGEILSPVVKTHRYSRYFSADKTFGYTTAYVETLREAIQRLCFYPDFQVGRLALNYIYKSSGKLYLRFADCDGLADDASIAGQDASKYFTCTQNLPTANYGRFYLKNSENIEIGYADIDLAKLGNLEILGSVSKTFQTAGLNCYDKDFTILASSVKKNSNLTQMIENLGNIAIRLGGQNAGNVIYPQNNIVLSTNGDSIEITFGSIDADSFENGGYTFTKGVSPTRGIFVTNSKYRVRADDGTWLLSARTFASGKTLKVSYENGNVLFYIDGVLDYTYTGQKTITIQSFGNGVVSNYLYWNGVINGMKVNGSVVDIYTYFTFGNSASLYRTNSFLTDAQAAQIEASFPSVFAEKTASSLSVYRKIRGSYYIKYPLVYRYKAYTADEYPSFYDNWGINPLALCRYESGSMIQIALLFNPGETELAINVENLNDGSTYVGGAAHGFENIVSINSTRQINFLVDDTAVAEDSVFALKEVSSVKVTQLSELCQAYTNSNPWAEATKEWHWDKDGFAISTSVKVLRSLQISQAQFGMFCVFRHWLGEVSNDYLTNKGIKNSDPYKIYTIEDGWESNPDNAEYHNRTFDCTRITQYGERGLGFAMQIVDATTKSNGGMFVGTNNTKYNKIYFDLTGSYLPSVNEILKATQKWYISGQPIL